MTENKQRDKNPGRKAGKQKKLGLSLRGGMARCLGYLGVLKALEEEDIQIDYIVGSSMGALLGSIYATGKYSIDELIEIGRTMKLSKMFGLESLRDLAILGDSFTEEMFGKYVGNALIENLKIKTWVQVTNLDKEKAEYISSGPVKKYVLASIAFPFLIKPVIIDGQTLIDGDITASYGVEFLRKKGADIVFAIEPGENDKPVNHDSLMSRMIEPMIVAGHMDRMNELKTNPPDLMISNIGKDVEFYEFGRVDELVEIGHSRMKRKMDELKGILY